MEMLLAKKNRSRMGVMSTALAISVVAIIIAISSLAYAFVAPSLQPKLGQTTPQTREFTVVTSTVDFNETQAGIPHDTFTPNQITVNQGDKVIMHFINTEDKPERHTFTLPAYNINVDLGMGQKQDITFTATQAGVFQFRCTYHLPTMSGQLVVLPSS